MNVSRRISSRTTWFVELIAKFSTNWVTKRLAQMPNQHILFSKYLVSKYRKLLRETVYQISNEYKHDFGFLLSFVTEQFRSCFWLLAAFRIIINRSFWRKGEFKISNNNARSLASNKHSLILTFLRCICGKNHGIPVNNVQYAVSVR